jgi:AraC-like DNA-binding protein
MPNTAALFRAPGSASPFPAESTFKYVEVLKTRRKHDHSHVQVEILLVTAGRGTRIIGNTLADFGEGELFVLGSRLPHTFFPSPESRSEVKTLVIQFSPGILSTSLAAFPEFGGMESLLDRARLGLSVRGPTCEAVSSLMRRIGGLPPASPRRIGLFVAILAELADSEDLVPVGGLAPLPLRRGSMDVKLDLACRLIQSRLENPLPQGALAERLGMSPPAFSRWFKRNMGKPYTEYVKEARIELACRALLESERDIARIGSELGFGGKSHFLKAFKAMKGVSPSAYRRLAREAEAAPSAPHPKARASAPR